MLKVMVFWVSLLPLPTASVALMTIAGTRAKVTAVAIAALAVLVAGMGSGRTRGAVIWRRSSTVAALAGIAAGAFTMWAAWDHNPQGEFHDGSEIHWAYWLSIGLAWFIPAYVVVLALGVIVFGVGQLAVAAAGALPRR
jgi:hypothetical protein